MDAFVISGVMKRRAKIYRNLFLSDRESRPPPNDSVPLIFPQAGNWVA
jgi:hypothetical protein